MASQILNPQYPWTKVIIRVIGDSFMTDTQNTEKWRAPVIHPVGGRYWIKRLNVLLRFAHQDLSLLNNGAYEDFLDDLYQAIHDRKRNRDDAEDAFNRSAKRENVREAQKGLHQAIHDRSNDPTSELKLERQTLIIGQRDDGSFWNGFWSDDFPTIVYMAFSHLLEASILFMSDFRICSNDKCEALFVPLRKLRKDDRPFCSTKCRNRINAVEYRKEKGEELREKERLRSEKRYKAKIATKFPKAKMTSKKRKSK